MVEQYRYPIEAISLEFPAGSLEDEGEEPEGAARRELSEEIAMEADELVLLGSFCPLANVTNVRTFVFLATGLQRGQPEREVTEQMEVRTVRLVDIEGLFREGRIQDATAILSYFVAKPSLAGG